MNDPRARGGVRRYLDTVKPEEYVPQTGEVNLQEMTLTGLADLFGSDKGSIKHNYTKHYERIICDLLKGTDRRKAILRVVEAGVACGASLHMWSHYLPRSFVIGYDIREECKDLCKSLPNVEIRIEDLCKSKLKEEFVDLFIDDASHISEHMVDMFKYCWPSVSPGGYYVIEDMGCTYNSMYTDQFKRFFDKNVVNDRSKVINLIDFLMLSVDTESSVEEIYYYKQMLVLRKKNERR